MFGLNEDIPNFYRQLAKMVDAGLPLLRSLSVIEQQSDSKTKKVATIIRDRIENGSTLYEASAGFPAIFSELDRNLIQASENSGRLHQVLSKIAESKSSWIRLYKQIIAKMIYPLILLHVAAFVKGIVSFFSSNEIQALTEVLQVLLPLYAVLILIISIHKMSVNQPFIRNTSEWLMYHTPILHTVVIKLAIARYTRTLETLMDAGNNLVQSHLMAADTAGNIVISNQLIPAAESIKAGNPLSTALVDCGFFSNMILNMIITGEESGRVVEMLDKVSETTQFEAEQSIERMGKLIPMLIYFFIVCWIISVIFGLAKSAYINPINELL